MTAEELRRLRRGELIDIILRQQEEIDRLTAQRGPQAQQPQESQAERIRRLREQRGWRIR